MLTIEETRDIANHVLSNELGPSGFASAQVSAGEDHDGEPALFVIVHFRSGAGATPGERSAEARVALREQLRARGEERLVYLRYTYPDAVPSTPDLDES